LEPHFSLSNVEKITALRLDDVRQYSSATTASIPSQPTIINLDFWQNLLEMSANEGLLSNKVKQPDKDIKGKPWITGGVKRFPVFGVCALLGNILCKAITRANAAKHVAEVVAKINATSKVVQNS
jgi:hypothetical protein